MRGLETLEWRCVQSHGCQPEGSRSAQLGWAGRVEDIERLLLNDKTRDYWPPEETNSIPGQRQGWIAQSFCVIKFY